MDKPLVSIITPCYNGELYVGRFIDSVLSQTYPNLELIIINDGSTDQTEEVVNSYRKKLEDRGIRFIYLYQENAGQAAALNRGLKLFSGDYLTWPDSDDEIMPEFIEKKVQFLQNNSQYVYCYGKAIEVKEEEPDKIVAVYEKRKKSGRYDFFEDILFVKDVFFPGYLVKSLAFDSIIPNREIYTGKGGQNAQILLPFSWYYGEPGYVEESVYKYYVRNNSHSHSQNTSEKIIKQLYDYENILVATLNKISDNKIFPYILSIKKYYAKLRFGNAIDTKKPKLIRNTFYELIKVRGATMRHIALYIKYTNKIIRKMFRIEG